MSPLQEAVELTHIRPVPKQTFMKRFKRYEPTVLDHSSIILAKECLRKYFYRVVLGFAPPVVPQYLGFGSAYHKFREILEKEFMKGTDDQQKTEDFQMTCFQTAMGAALKLWTDRKMKDPIVGDKWDFMTKTRLALTCGTAFKHWQREKQQGRIEVIATEQNIVVPLPDGEHVGGKADEIVRWNGKVWGRDFKTSSQEQNEYFKRTLDPNDQFTGYSFMEQELCGEPVQGQLVQVMYNAKGTKKEPQRGPEIFPYMATRSSWQIEKWVEERMHFNLILQLSRERDVWPQEEKNCRYCAYHSVCKGATENAQAAKLEAEMVVSPWNFLERDADTDG
ncbi:MAG TPA: PD-(D/E)XK nuclease family protein [Candidatus Bathyarchaeia archaeon]